MRNTLLLFATFILFTSCLEQSGDPFAVLPVGDPANKEDGLSSFEVEFIMEGDYKSFMKIISIYSTDPVAPLIDTDTGLEFSTYMTEDKIITSGLSTFNLHSPKPVSEVFVSVVTFHKILVDKPTLIGSEERIYRTKKDISMKFTIRVTRDGKELAPVVYELGLDRYSFSESFAVKGI